MKLTEDIRFFVALSTSVCGEKNIHILMQNENELLLETIGNSKNKEIPYYFPKDTIEIPQAQFLEFVNYMMYKFDWKCFHCHKKFFRKRN